MNTIQRALRDFLAVRPADVASAIVDGFAVSVRAEPRFTRDLDLAVAVAYDDEARWPRRGDGSTGSKETGLIAGVLVEPTTIPATCG